MIKLYPHQTDAIAALRATLRAGAPVALLSLPTGSGKTFLFSEFIRQMIEKSPKATFLVIVPKVKLCEQNAAAIERIVGKAPAVYCASLGRMETGAITVGTFQSLMKINDPPKFDVIILDEVHRFNTEKDSLQRKMLESLSHTRTRVIGVTATPFRGTRPLWRVSDYWPEPCFTVSIGELTRLGLLCPARMVQGKHAHSTKGFKVVQGDWSRDDLNKLSADTDKTSRQVKDALGHIDRESRKSVIWMCIDQAHARSVHELLLARGETSALVISDQSSSERTDAFDSYISSGARHLVSVEIAKEGFDNPATDCVVFLKATRSIVSYIQAVGRSLRIYSGKAYALILDYGQVVASCGKLDSPLVDWTGEAQDSQAARKRLADEMSYVVVNCKSCGSFFFPERGDAKDCPDCGENQDDQKTRKLREQAASGELYSSKDLIDSPFSRFAVLGFKCQTTDQGGTLILTVKSMAMSGAATGTVALEMYAPIESHGLDQWRVNRIAHTKRWLAKGFGIDTYTTAREMLRLVQAQEVAVCPHVITQVKTKLGYAIEATRPIASGADIQETLI